MKSAISREPGLPMLPGYAYGDKDPYKTRHHKTQLLGVKDGTICESTKFLAEPVSEGLLATMTEGQPTKMTGVPKRAPAQNEGIPVNPPRWLAMDRQVLNFTSYYQEPVIESNIENYRVRKLTIHYHLDDETIHIIEPRQENSQIPQGEFLKRGKIPFPDPAYGHEYYTYEDLNVGLKMVVYGKVLKIINCDDFTRSFYKQLGRTMGPKEEFPDNKYEGKRIMNEVKVTPEDMGEQIEYREVKLAGGHPNRGLQQYIEGDRKVLSFKILWEDRTYEGGENFFNLDYFLADDTMMIRECRSQNMGKDPFPKLLNRMKVPISYSLPYIPGMKMKREEFYKPEHLICGKCITVFSRDCLIMSCDPFTSKWYKAKLGMEQVPVPLAPKRPDLKYNKLPPPTGYGTEEDSLGSTKSLMPKVPKKDEKKIFKQDMHILRFESKLISTRPDDTERAFVISFFCGDDTILVSEIVQRNAGRVGGKFQERKQFINPISGKKYTEFDMQIGKEVILNSFKFRILKADEYTEKYWEENPHLFPNIMGVLNKFIQESKIMGGNIEDYAKKLMDNLDTNRDNYISFEEFFTGLRNANIYLTDQEEHILFRKFDTNHDGRISLEELYNALTEFSQNYLQIQYEVLNYHQTINYKLINLSSHIQTQYVLYPYISFSIFIFNKLNI